ncbi:HAD superfamily hydrolase (TIGR01549 family) [Granulicella aggregans]|uniref:HAD superfamily hydrolase (TIGR01549 family) n=1 Tax=Granulicella aggregans TaxID=474949 RepID=A0A7W7ZAX7_9BACT|nr:HAD family hydrolase [Granulicella aggregans]MBB5056528.1 HAD superfamily hydrolase (TIGR01549 family) [Granulicella aggregans]
MTLFAAGDVLVKAVLCDIDGTLVESNWLHAAAWRDAFSVIDVDVDLEEARRQIGKGGHELIPVFVPWWKRKVVEEPLKAYRKLIFEMNYLDQVEPFPKARELLVRMKEIGIRVSLASSAGQEQLEAYKKIANIDDVVEETTSADDADRAKPHPDIFEATLKKLKLRPRDVLALGDTPYDAEAAGKAEIWTVGVTTGGWSREELMHAGCVEVYKDVAELLENLETSAFCRF